MSNVGPIIFANEHARRRLIEYGSVVTYRSGERTTGQTWWRKSRTGEKCGDCRVQRIGAVTIDDERLDDLATDAGFEDGDEWREAIIQHHGRQPSGVLYRVVTTDAYGQPGGGRDA